MTKNLPPSGPVRDLRTRLYEKAIICLLTGCWLWTGTRTQNGYALLSLCAGVPRPTTTVAHRVSYELYWGPIPDGLELDHLCRVRHCVNPAHLEPVTHQENMSRCARAVRTHCAHGHEFTPKNTYMRPNSGGRRCRACKRAQGRASSIPGSGGGVVE